MQSTMRRALKSSLFGALFTIPAVISVLGPVLGGCSSGSSSSGPPDTGHFANAMAQTFCGALHSCCDSQKYAYDNGSCTAQLQATFQSAVDVVKHGKVVYDQNAVGACQDAIKKREAACSEDGGPAAGADTQYVDPISAACWSVFKGTVAPGGECTLAAECQTPDATVGSNCQTDNRQGADPSKKVCFTYQEHVKPGDACRAQPKQGEFTVAACEPSLGYCDTSGAPSTDPTAGTCKPFLNVGDNCVGTNPQSTPRCNPKTSFCDYASTRTCVALPQAGEACGTSFPACAPGLYCDRTGGTSPGTCTAPKPDGSSCVNSQECASQYCQTTFDGGVQQGTCSANGVGSSHDLFDISPRTCGFGPQGSGSEDAGIAPPAKAQAIAPQRASDSQWWLGAR